MAIDFPSSPVNGQTYTVNNVTWTYNSTYGVWSAANYYDLITGNTTNSVINQASVGANAFASATIAGANTAVGTGANNYLISIISGANTSVGAGANAWSNTKLSNSTGTFSGTLTITGNTITTNVIISGGIQTSANGNYGSAGQVLTTNGSATYWSTPTITSSVSKYSVNIGDGSNTTINVTHSLNKTDLWFTVREISSGYIVYPDIVYSNANACQFIFVTAPTANQYYVSILGA
jgi:hypothetical protein